MKVPAVFAGTVAVPDGRIFVITGTAKRLSGAVRVYDPATDTWTEKTPIPTPRTAPAAAVGADGKIYVVGGGDREAKCNVTEAYDPKADTWARLRPMPTPREDLWAVAAKGQGGRVHIYVIGGRDHAKPGNGLSTMEAYDPVADAWTALAPMPTPRHGHAATLGPDGRIYVLGGTNDKVFATPVVEIYDPLKDSWARGTPMPYGQECAAATFRPGPDGEVVVLSGWDIRHRLLRSAVAYNPRTATWRSLPDVPTPRAGAGAVALPGPDGRIQIYLLGGIPDSRAVEVYSFKPVELPRGKSAQ
jgi:N-acetylneuraminic acid mutarotase